MRLTETTLMGKRIYLREVCLSDVNDDYYRWMNDPEVTGFTVSRGRYYSKIDLQNYVNDKINDEDTIFLAIVLKNNDKHIGNIKLGPINWKERIGDTGLIIGEKNYWGKGYGSEAIKILCEYAFSELGLHRLTAGYFTGNPGSLKAFVKNGFTVESTTWEYYPGDQNPVDVTWLALVNSKSKSRGEV